MDCSKCIISWFFTWRAFIMILYCKNCLGTSIWPLNPLKQPKCEFFKWKIIVFAQNHGIFWPKGDLKPCTIIYLGNIHNMSWLQSLQKLFLQILQNGTFWAKLRRFKMAWTFLPNSAHFFCFKNWCKVTFQKKVPSPQHSAARCRWWNWHFVKKCIFGQKKEFSQKFIFYKMFSVPKYNLFSVPKIIFAVFKVNIFYHS